MDNRETILDTGQSRQGFAT